MANCKWTVGGSVCMAVCLHLMDLWPAPAVPRPPAWLLLGENPAPLWPWPGWRGKTRWMDGPLRVTFWIHFLHQERKRRPHNPLYCGSLKYSEPDVTLDFGLKGSQLPQCVLKCKGLHAPARWWDLNYWSKMVWCFRNIISGSSVCVKGLLYMTCIVTAEDQKDRRMLSKLVEAHWSLLTNCLLVNVWRTCILNDEEKYILDEEQCRKIFDG